MTQQIFIHKNHPNVRVILKHLTNYTTGRYYRIDSNNKIMKRKKALCADYENYTLIIRHNNLIKEAKATDSE